MKAYAGVSVSVSANGDILYNRLRSQAPLLLRPTSWGLYLVGGAANPLGGDYLSLEIEVANGTSLVVRSTAASMARRGPGELPSELRIDVQLAEGAVLYWQPEPTIACAGCNHRIEALVDMATGAALYWRDELVLGRYAESTGSITSLLSVDYGGKPLVRHELSTRLPGWDGPSVLGGSGAVGSILAVNLASPIQASPLTVASAKLLPSMVHGDPREHLPSSKAKIVKLIQSEEVVARGTAMPLNGPAIMISATGRDFIALRRAEEMLTHS
ncbi:MAG: urease accessory protein UreD [Actinobacteria bacterium]|jgi:urease accessory protein|nr:urease accessory protein UreD [Actinomycetota bacterium]MCL6095678.1 urease accessory protein UreD [Actinomycetota bacterium]